MTPLAPRTIRSRRTRIETQLDLLSNQLTALRARCEHVNVSRVAGSNTGNYDPSADSYWYDFDCRDCGKHWRERQ